MFCRDKHTFVATKDVFCCDQHVFVASKMIIVAAPANETYLSARHSVEEEVLAGKGKPAVRRKKENRGRKSFWVKSSASNQNRTRKKQL